MYMYIYKINVNHDLQGTRISAAKQAASAEYSRAAGLPVLKHHLLPRCNLVIIISSRPDHCRCHQDERLLLCGGARGPEQSTSRL